MTKLANQGNGINVWVNYIYQHCDTNTSLSSSCGIDHMVMCTCDL